MRIFDVFAITILAVWVLAMLASGIPSLQYEPDPSITAVMTIAAGAVFAKYSAEAIGSTLRSVKDKKREEDQADE